MFLSENQKTGSQFYIISFYYIKVLFFYRNIKKQIKIIPPKKVIVIRHCDKPDDKDDYYGKCNSDGYKRSYLLAGIKGPCDGENAKTASCNNDCPSLTYWSILL